MEVESGLRPKLRHGLDWFFSLLTLAVCLTATLPQIRVGDYKAHIGFAVEMEANTPVPVPHALFQKLILTLRTLLPFRILPDFSGFWQYLYDHSFTACAILIAMAAYLATVLILQKNFYKNWQALLPGRAYFYAWFASFGLLLVDPIILFTLKSRLILGYLPANLWHNPTYILVRPFALWLFFYVLDHWNKKTGRPAWLLVAFISYLAVFAKPNFSLSFLPALGLFCVLQARPIRTWNWGLLTAIALPALFSLAYQYWFTIRYPSASSFAFGPFVSALYYNQNFFDFLIKLALSIAFPLAVLAFDFKESVKSSGMRLAWLNFGVALLTFLLFTETPHVGMLNFSWGAVIAVFILFVISLNHLVLNLARLTAQAWKAGIIWALLAFHWISGVVYTVITLLFPGPVR